MYPDSEVVRLTLLLVIGLAAAWFMIGPLVCLALCTSAARGDRSQARANLVLAGGPRRFERDHESAV